MRLPARLTEVLIAVAPALAPSSAEEPTKHKDVSPLSEEAAATVDALVALAREEFAPMRGASWTQRSDHLAKAHAKFLELLKDLDTEVDEQTARKVAGSTSPGIVANLSGMARSYTEHPERYAELITVYAPPEDPKAHVHRPSRRVARHAKEEYRPTWELLLLAPTIQQSRFMRPTCFEALGAIRNDASIPLLAWVYERANADVQLRARSNMASTDQVEALGALNRYCSAASLRAMLRCVALSESLPPPLPEPAGFTMKQRLGRYLRDEAGYGNGEQWRKVIAKVLEEKEKLSEADRALLEDALKPPEKK